MIRLFTVCIALFFICCSINLKAASTDSTFKNQYTIYVNQPIGFLTKARIAIECRFTDNLSWVLSYARFYQITPGQHGYVELRKYTKTERNIDHVQYAKVGAGHTFGSVGLYALAGAGVGEKIYFDRDRKFSLYCSQGLKLCPNIKGEHDTGTGGFGGFFYFAGPGAFFDLTFNLGYQF
jgi:hypothetical protein